MNVFDIIKKGKEGVDWYLCLLSVWEKVFGKYLEIKEFEENIW